MIIQKTKFILIVACVALFAGCAATDPNIDSAKMSRTLMDYEGVIESAEAAIEANPESGDGYYYKGIGLTQKAFDQDPQKREQLYSEAKEFFDQAKELYETEGKTGDEAAELPNYIVDVWGEEHNLGIGLIAEDFVSTEEDSLILAEHHLNNATAINPDSVQSYSILYEVNYLLGNTDEAISNAEHTVHDLGSTDLYNYYRLSYFYQEEEDYDSALDILHQAREDNPDEIEVVQELANLYLTLGDTDRALETTQSLIDSDPENPQYRLVYGTQVYQLVLDMDETISGYYDEVFENNQEIREENSKAQPNTSRIQELEDRNSELNSNIEDLQEDVDHFSDRAEEELQIAAELNPDNPAAHSTLGIIYQNRAAALFERRNATEDMALAEELDSEARELLEASIPFYAEAAELEPDNPENWRALFRVYTTLGMDEEAQEAQEKAGI
ncbi:MAG: tetratricopeptide repeat protein [Balneolales bacterium]